MKSYNILFILLMMSVITVPVAVGQANAGIYKWTDKDGNVHFGDRPADIDTATELHIKTNNSTGIKNSSGNKKEREYLLKKIEEDDKADAEKRKEKAANDKKRRSLCNSYRSELQAYSQFGRVFTVAPDGERTYLTDQQRAAKKNKLKKGVAKYCR